MKLCPKCKNLAYENSYFGIYYCPECGWKEPLVSLNIIDRVRKLHEQGWTVELRWGYFHSEPHFMVDIMNNDFLRYTETSNISVEDAFNKAYSRLVQAKT